VFTQKRGAHVDRRAKARYLVIAVFYTLCDCR
jgi:hypothetical protein